MKALDLFCGGGGAGVGLARAGFEVTGVDIVAQPDYPLAFNLGDALRWPLKGFDLVWASPPCQAFTAYRRRGYTPRAPVLDLIPALRRHLQRSKHYVIENVAGAPLKNPTMLCGSMFGLDVRRHRYFESSFTLKQPGPCRHNLQLPRFPAASNRVVRRTVEVGAWRIPLAVQQQAMGVDWLPLRLLSQAIPPAYSEHIAREFLKFAHSARP